MFEEKCYKIRTRTHARTHARTNVHVRAHACSQVQYYTMHTQHTHTYVLADVDRRSALILAATKFRLIA